MLCFLTTYSDKTRILHKTIRIYYDRCGEVRGRIGRAGKEGKSPVRSGEALIRSDGQLDKRLKAVRRGEVELKEGK